MGTETDTSKLKTKLAIADFWEFWRTKADGYHMVLREHIGVAKITWGSRLFSRYDSHVKIIW